tara:strand:+ start:415 stop:645 length:231 start_codon:yes stop_codon:yes gene_type:complete
MNLIGTIEVDTTRSRMTYSVREFMSDYSRNWANYDYQIINDGELRLIEIYGLSVSVGILYEVLAELNDEGYDAFIY